jgi:general stress protein 26
MDAFEPESDMTVWMATDPKTRKVRQLRHDPRATLAYDLGGGRGYITLIGRVQLVDDEGERRSHWKSGWEAFYPEGPTGVDYLLLKFTPSRIEAMSIPENVGAIPFSPAILLREDSTWKLHERSG